MILHLVARSRQRRDRRPLHRRAAPDRGRLCAGRADQQEADRRARSARHPPAGAGRAGRRLDPRVGDLRARHHRRRNSCATIEHGEVVVIDGRRASQSLRPFAPAAGRAPASSNTSISPGPIRSSDGRSVYDVRKAHGRAAGATRPRSRPTSSCRCPIPAFPRRSATRRHRGIPFELGIIRNHYVGRTFIQPTQADPRSSASS